MNVFPSVYVTLLPTGFRASDRDAPGGVWCFEGSLPRDRSCLKAVGYLARSVIVYGPCGEEFPDRDAELTYESAVCDLVSGNETLEMLVLDHLTLGSQCLSTVAAALPRSGLTEFHLIECTLGAGSQGLVDVFGALARAKLKLLRLHRIRLEPPHVAELVRCLPLMENLRELHLIRCSIGPAATSALVSVIPWRSLRELDLGENDAGEEAIVAIAEALSLDSTVLMYLRAWTMTTGAREAEALAAALRINATLVDLDLTTSGSIADAARPLRRCMDLHNGTLDGARVCDMRDHNDVTLVPTGHARRNELRARQRAALLTLALCSTGEGLAADVVPRLLGGIGINRDGDDAMKRTFRGFAHDFCRRY